MELITGVGLGAGVMYFLDPNQGTRRRSLLRDKAVRLSNEACHGSGKVWRDLKNRSQGLWARATRLFRGCEQVPDDVLVARVRATVGRCVSHPRALQVTADHGVVTLSGPVLVGEDRGLIECVARVPGVEELLNDLDVHDASERIPALAGEPSPRHARHGALAPAHRFLTCAGGFALGIYGAQRRDALGAAIAAAGAGVCAMAFVDRLGTRLPFIGKRSDPSRRRESPDRVRETAPM
jgi:hypothetical protein